MNASGGCETAPRAAESPPVIACLFVLTIALSRRRRRA
jgi:uncharacterized protein (TIGR03382 family)